MTATATRERPSVPDVGDPSEGDGRFLERLRAGDDSALGALYDQHADVVFGIARRVTGDEHLAREVTQEVFTHLWQHPDRVDLARGTVRTYLAVVAHRRAVDEVRRVVRRTRAESRAACPAGSVDDSHESGVVDAAASAWRGQRVATMLEQLPDDQRAAVMLAYFDGHTYREVAELSGIPEGTAKSRLRLALARLRLLLDDDIKALT